MPHCENLAFGTCKQQRHRLEQPAHWCNLIRAFIDFCLDSTVDSEMFARTLFLPIFANSVPREFKVLANIENACFYIAILTN